ncbi:hypothetical protein ACOSQ3_000659 [Xanthoceras sorbifolium]
MSSRTRSVANPKRSRARGRQTKATSTSASAPHQSPFKRKTMETTSIARHQFLRSTISGTADRFSIKFHLGIGDLRVPERPRKCFGRLTSRFSDSGHQQYYVSSRSGTEKKEKENSSEIKLVKNKLKLIKRLSSDLSLFSKESGNCLMDEAKISDAVELLQAQLQQLRSEQKDLKRKMKEEKAHIKATLKQTKCKSDSSSSSSSDSSDSECGEIIDMSRLRNDDCKQSKYSEAQKDLQVSTLAGPSSLIQQDKSEELVQDEVLSLQNPTESCSGGSNSHSNDQSNSITDWTSTKRIEICMGGKCKKSGAEALLEEFQRKVGAEGAVLGCKCMGKCKNGPNLRVSNSHCEVEATRTQDSGRPSIDSICIGVGLRDVDVILGNIFGKDGNEKYLMAPS